MPALAEALESMVPISAFNKGQASRIFDRLENESQIVVLRHNAPCAIILSPAEYTRLCSAEYDSGLINLAIERLRANKGKEPLTEAQLMDALGITEGDLNAAEDVDVA